ncbi:MAG: alpha/beta hydrolase family protein [Bryobacteraceae bacterium]
MVRGWLHEPPADPLATLALTHGAGANCDAPLLIVLAEAFAQAGIVTLRFDLPYRQIRPHGPPIAAQASRDREGIRQAAETLRELTKHPVFLGGHSYGGRQASMTAAENPDLAAALLLLSYPLHPPRKREQLRIQHFDNLHTPALFVHGTRDPFGSIEELNEAIQAIPARTGLLAIEGAPHGVPPSQAGRIVSQFIEFTKISQNESAAR